MQKLHCGKGIPRLSDVQPSMPALRGTPYSADWDLSHQSNRMQQATSRHAGCVGGMGPRRAADSGAGEGAVLHWPGKGHGVRQPGCGETVLSWSEVMHGVREGIIGPVVLAEVH